MRVHELDEGDEHLGEKVVSLLGPGDRVLVKGSRGMRLERVRAALERLGPLGPEGGGGLTGTMRTGATERVRVGRGWGDAGGPGERGAGG